MHAIMPLMSTVISLFKMQYKQVTNNYFHCFDHTEGHIIQKNYQQIAFLLFHFSIDRLSQDIDSQLFIHYKNNLAFCFHLKYW
jgi:hypothetical protein